MTTLRLSPLFLALGLAPSFALAAPAGTVLFSRGNVQIIDAKGKARPAARGASIQNGERIVAPPGTVSQIRMVDGSLFGVRPDTEFRVELPGQAAEKAGQTVSLLKGGLRVINADMRDGRKRDPVTLQTGASVVQLVNGDMESFFVRAEAGKGKVGAEGGSYTRMISGSGSVRSGSFEVPLALQTIAYVPKTDVEPVTTSAVSSTMFVTPTFTTSLSTLSGTSGTTSTSGSTLTTSTISPSLATSTSTSSLTTSLSSTTSTLTSPTLLSSTTLLSPTTSTYIAPTTTLTSSTLTTTTLTTSPTLTTTYVAPTTLTTKTLVYSPPPPTTVTCKTCSTVIIKK